MIAAQTFGRIFAVKLLIVATLVAFAFAVSASTVVPTAGVGAGSVMSVDAVAPGSAVALATAETMGWTTGLGLPILVADLTYGIIDTTARSFGITRPSAAVSGTLATQTAMTRGDPNTTKGFGLITNLTHTLNRSFGALPGIATNFAYGLGIAFMLVLITGAVYVFARRLRYVTQATPTRMSTSGALALTGGPQARHRGLTTSSSSLPTDDIRRRTSNASHGIGSRT